MTVCYLGLSFSHPDYWVARYNVAKMEEISPSDYAYFSDLSADAAPILVSYLKEEDKKAQELHFLKIYCILAFVSAEGKTFIRNVLLDKATG